MDSETREELADYSTKMLESIRGELEWLFESKLYSLFQETCSSTKEGLMDGALRGKLSGIESILEREQVMGEAIAWDNLKQVFVELQETVTTKIKARKK